MVSLEVVNTVAYENLRPARPYGLVHPKDIEKFRAPEIDACELQLLDVEFDDLCVRTGEGFAEFDGDTVRFDARHEVGNTWTRSLSILQGYSEEGSQVWKCISRINDYVENVYLLECHEYTIDQEGFITEPPMGSEGVTPGTYSDFMKHVRAAEEATPVAQVLSRTA